MTEDDAKTNRCCGPEHVGREEDGMRRCVGSRCMAWRWLREEIRDYAGEDDMEGLVYAHGPSDCEGYCGLAMAPVQFEKVKARE